MVSAHPLDNPAWSALLGPQAHLAVRCGNAIRFPPDVSPFIALPDDPAEADWDDLAKLVGPGAVAASAGVPVVPPPGWRVLMTIDGVQLTGADVAAAPDDEAIALGPADVPDMLDLVARTKPGPFLARTLEFGGYLGIRRGGALVAMAGERLRPPGWTEISAVCTDPAVRGQGLGTRLTLAVAAAISARGDTPFLHASADNVSAIRLYQSLGFRFRRPASFVVARAPAATPGSPLSTGAGRGHH
jgi:ribosomal protein S18 acetylase RimI-like enzyme